MANETVFRRYEHNPIVAAGGRADRQLHLQQRGGPVWNRVRGRVRVDSVRMEAGLHAGFSDDGLAWRIEAAPMVFERQDPDGPDVNYDGRFQYDPSYADRRRVLRDLVPLPTVPGAGMPRRSAWPGRRIFTVSNWSTPMSLT